MKTGFLIIGRLKSTRLPKKLLLNVEGRPIITHMFDRLKQCKRVDEIILCTSTNLQDDSLENLANHENISVFRGDEDDVVKRLYDASLHFNLDYITHITADCPFVDPDYVDTVVETYEKNSADLIRTLDLPHGAFCYGIKPSALKKVIEIKDSNDTEVWGRYFTDTGLFNVFDMPIINQLHCKRNLRMTLDYPEDYEFFKEVFKALYVPGKIFNLDEILNYLADHPEVVAINNDAEARYKVRWSKQSRIKLKKQLSVKNVAIIGSGSIGQRHIKNLQKLGIKNICALRTRKGHFQKLDKQLNVHEVDTLRDLLKFKPDVAVISNPTNMHVQTAKKIIPHVRGIFIEKPLSHSPDGIDDFLDMLKTNRVTSFVGFNMRFHPVILKCNELIANYKFGKPVLFQCQVGQYLPHWHPYENYEKGYYARKDLGGGVTLTMIHEIDLALNFMGLADTVSCFLNQYKQFKIDVDSISDIMIRHKSGVVSQIHLDYVQQNPNRCGILSFEHGWIKYDLILNEIIYCTTKMDKPKKISENINPDANTSYLSEMKCFISYTEQGLLKHEHDTWSSINSQNLANAALTSSSSSRIIKVDQINF